MDYTGSGVFQQSQLEQAFNEISSNMYGNAHSRNPSAERTEHAIAVNWHVLYTLIAKSVCS